MNGRRLVLFDIDGTLLNGGKLWREVFETAFGDLYPGVRFPKVPFSGKTDRQICAEVFDATLVATAGAERELLVDRLIEAYLKELGKAIGAGRGAEVEILPGVHGLLDALQAQRSVCLGLLTGNVLPGAKLKLGATGLDRYFQDWLGAFGDDHVDRYQLPQIAVQRAHARLGTRYEGKEVVIIGDTQHDVNCGKSIGVRSIAVATGRAENRAALLAAAPDFFFESFEPPQAVFEAILKPGY